MIEEDYVQDEPVYELVTEPAPAPPDLAPEPSVVEDLEESSAPVEVISVDELLDRLTQPEEEIGDSEESEDIMPADFIEDVIEEPAEIIMMEDMLGHLNTLNKTMVKLDERLETIDGRLEVIEQTVFHPLLTTPFEDYTVTEGLFLLLILFLFVAACAKLLKGGFSWLR